MPAGLALLDRAAGAALLVLAALVAARVLAPRLLAAGGRLPGLAGRSAQRTARWLRPGLVRRLLSLVVGLAAPVAVTAPTAAAPAASSELTPVATQALPSRPPASFVVVRPGDTLWGIARRHLRTGATDAQVARAWPRWYAANRHVIGSDPNLILPGTRLRVPGAGLAHEASPRPAGTPEQHHRPASQHVDASSLDPDRR